jgi:hypothetical protein
VTRSAVYGHFILFYVYFYIILCNFMLFYYFILFYVLFVCICVLYCCHRVFTQLQLTNISIIINHDRTNSTKIDNSESGGNKPPPKRHIYLPKRRCSPEYLKTSHLHVTWAYKIFFGGHKLQKCDTVVDFIRLLLTSTSQAESVLNKLLSNSSNSRPNTLAKLKRMSTTGNYISAPKLIA